MSASAVSATHIDVLLSVALRGALTAQLPGYPQAPWEWTPETLAARRLIAPEAALSVTAGGDRPCG